MLIWYYLNNLIPVLSWLLDGLRTDRWNILILSSNVSKFLKKENKKPQKQKVTVKYKQGGKIAQNVNWILKIIYKSSSNKCPWTLICACVD